MIQKCRLCQSNDLSLFYTQGNQDQFRFYRCGKCKLVNYDLSKGLNQEKYGDYFIDPREADHPANRVQSNTFKFIKKNFSKKGSLLEIGCGFGRILYLARNEGWTVSGLELSPFLATSIYNAVGIQVTIANFLEDESFKDRLFDLVVLRHVLEHLPDSIAAMNKINALLRTGGAALLEFPNIDGLDLRYKRLIRKSGLYRKRYPVTYIPGHCNEFNLESFSFLLSETGFSLEHWETYSSKPSAKGNLYNLMPLGNKARAVARKK